MSNEKPINPEDTSPSAPKQDSSAPPIKQQSAKQNTTKSKSEAKTKSTNQTKTPRKTTKSMVSVAGAESSISMQGEPPKPDEPPISHNEPSNLPKKSKKPLSENVKNFRKAVSVWLPIVAALISVATFILVFIQSYYTRQSVIALQEQLILQRESLEKDLPAQFAVEYEDPGINERVFIVNPGKVDLNHVVAEMKFYFLFPDGVFQDGNIKTRPQLENVFSKNPTLFKQVQDSNLFVFPQDMSNFLGGQRRFEIPAGLKAEEKQILNNLSPSVIANAVRLTQALNCVAIIRWRIEYTEKVTRRKNISYVFTWIHLPKPNNTRGREGLEREDLTTVIGGKKIIVDITKIEEESKEVLFGIE